MQDSTDLQRRSWSVTIDTDLSTFGFFSERAGRWKHTVFRRLGHPVHHVPGRDGRAWIYQ
ncbi:unnamed protein product [Dicrocoelium dendriticum]|nr:unnamed protein product [Dicrocoelium dendriticum]